jgi:CDP-paratose 2-epimerase
MLEQHFKRKIPLKFDQWRPGDQEVYVSDVRKLEKTLNWKPSIDAKAGVGKLIQWVEENRAAF